MQDLKHATLIRVTNDGLAYLVDDGTQAVIPFTFDKIARYRGESVAELGISEGTAVTYSVDSENRVTDVVIGAKSTHPVDRMIDYFSSQAVRNRWVTGICIFAVTGGLSVTVFMVWAAVHG